MIHYLENEVGVVGFANVQGLHTVILEYFNMKE
jgi:hypothetical protein